MAEKLFLKQVDAYAKGRPSYPAALFERLASLTQRHDRAWDVGTGNGQAAIMVAEHYKSVVATDISEPQLSLATQHPNVTYSKLSATPSPEELERVVGAEGSVDLVTVATALHYFDLEKFFPIVKHLLRKPGGVFAAWTYSIHNVSPQIDELTVEWHKLLKQYWGPGAEYAFEEYRTIPFPFEPVAAQEGRVEPEFFNMEKSMTLDNFWELWKSASFVQTAREHGFDILTEERVKATTKAWGSEEVRIVTFPTALLIGTVSPASEN
ncbi:unnamed protein product [Calypogeia fissa]